MRVFIGFQLSPDVREALISEQVKLEKQFGTLLRFTAPHNVHLTVRFIGEVEPEAVARFGVALEEVSKE